MNPTPFFRGRGSYFTSTGSDPFTKRAKTCGSDEALPMD